MAMHPKRKQRLMIVLSIVIGASVAAGLLFYAMKDNLNLFFPPTEIKEGKAPIGQRIRAGGMVEKGSIKRLEDGLTVRFNITDYEATVAVEYTGILPDLFAEDSGVVVAGVLQKDGIMVADEVLAKHDENYMPPEVEATLKDVHNQPTTSSDSVEKAVIEAVVGTSAEINEETSTEISEEPAIEVSSETAETEK